MQCNSSGLKWLRIIIIQCTHTEINNRTPEIVHRACNSYLMIQFRLGAPQRAPSVETLFSKEKKVWLWTMLFIRIQKWTLLLMTAAKPHNKHIIYDASVRNTVKSHFSYTRIAGIRCKGNVWSVWCTYHIRWFVWALYVRRKPEIQQQCRYIHHNVDKGLQIGVTSRGDLKLLRRIVLRAPQHIIPFRIAFTIWATRLRVSHLRIIVYTLRRSISGVRIDPHYINKHPFQK